MDSDNNKNSDESDFTTINLYSTSLDKDIDTNIYTDTDYNNSIDKVIIFNNKRKKILFIILCCLLVICGIIIYLFLNNII